MPFDQPQGRRFISDVATKAILGALLFLIVGVGGDYVASLYGWGRDLLFVNDLLTALFVGILVYAYEKRRRKRVMERLAIVELMNHHVRNALQVIAFSPHAHQREENVAQIEEAVSRIEWALREILPGGIRAELRDPNADVQSEQVHTRQH